MTRNEFEELVFERYSVRADYPFEEDFETGVFRHENGKWFALVMNISERKLGKSGNMQTQVVNFKCNPEVVESIAGVEFGIYHAYHMNGTVNSGILTMSKFNMDYSKIFFGIILIFFGKYSIMQ